jgi:hypothetical protein
LGSRNQKKSTYFREMLAVYEARAKSRHYLLGHIFIICTDQSTILNHGIKLYIGHNFGIIQPFKLVLE